MQSIIRRHELRALGVPESQGAEAVINRYVYHRRTACDCVLEKFEGGVVRSVAGAEEVCAAVDED